MAKAKNTSQTSPQEAAIERSKLKSANFVRLAKQRMTVTLKKLDGVKQLSNRNAYSYDTVQVQKILNALKIKVNEIEKAFLAPADAPAVSSFEL